MITKAIIEEKITPYQYRVRIPIFDRVTTSPEHINFKDLAIATISIPRGINNNIQIGDIVFVGFEDNNSSQPIILGHLYREQLIKDNNSFLNISNIQVSDQASLPIATNINDINIYESILKIESLEEKINQLQQEIINIKQG